MYVMHMKSIASLAFCVHLHYHSVKTPDRKLFRKSPVFVMNPAEYFGISAKYNEQGSGEHERKVQGAENTDSSSCKVKVRFAESPVRHALSMDWRATRTCTIYIWKIKLFYGFRSGDGRAGRAWTRLAPPREGRLRSRRKNTK